MDIDHRLATYGTLAPGRSNHHHLSMIGGEWKLGAVRGELVENGWGAALGYPALVPSDDGNKVEVHLFEAADLPLHWQRLDDFEGAEYRRARINVETDDGLVEAWIYVDAR
jgi:gamma-glutamylcyclotransferase (GGCT)/AIG2-like uncharacterized protein YtfP